MSEHCINNNSSSTELTERRDSSVARSNSAKNWQLLKRNISLVRHAVGKANAGNKIGKLAAELAEDNPLRTIALAVQRSIRVFGRASAEKRGQKHNVEELKKMDSSFHVTEEGDFASPNVVEFEAHGDEKNDDGDQQQSTIYYKAYQPAFTCEKIQDEEFEKIRKTLGISERQYYSVLGLQERRSESDFSVVGAADAAGKSSSFFFVSPDQRFILKSTTSKEVKVLTSMLQLYRKYLEGCLDEKGNNTTLLPRYIGLYHVTFPHDNTIPSVSMVVMTNFFAGAFKIHQKFDLKGSTYHRFASEKERAKKSPVFKDNDWVDQGKTLIFSSAETKECIHHQLVKDTTFLFQQNLIDYSLLVGIHEKENKKRFSSHFELTGITYSQAKAEIYYFGIVDVLTPYGSKKRLETICTGYMLCRPDISCQPPDHYQQRFIDFVSTHVLAVEKKEDTLAQEQGFYGEDGMEGGYCDWVSI